MTDTSQNPDLSKMAKDLQQALKTADEVIEKALPFAAVAQAAFATVMESVNKVAKEATPPPRPTSNTPTAPRTEEDTLPDPNSYESDREWHSWVYDMAHKYAIVVSESKETSLNMIALRSATGTSPVMRVTFLEGIRDLLTRYGKTHLTVTASVIRNAYDELYVRRVEHSLPHPRKDAKKVNTEEQWIAVCRNVRKGLGTTWTKDEENSFVREHVSSRVNQFSTAS